ncbi:polysaccharide deacetylase family protein [Coraliomargarita algicola]|uniref:Polysaccharide deacetylase family protein n=1 Tax=Coraliomargarita algicola TaxID=3092156 RepID=A0ABZ0RKM1_9BACT|nr:polysaccharide deacetylase family protein [Coraliomargarita sp. J2-16]WPJ95467.1 polysaccharide deacetylase family protein [Coraliomargarita sp. J2-16]
MSIRVVQCWDDGVVDDIRLTELLRKHGAKASFNLNFGHHTAMRRTGWKYEGVKEVWCLARSELISVYEGFTIANHGYRHVPPARSTLEEAREDIRKGRDSLEQHFGCPVLGYAYPGGSFDEATMALVREAGHIYGRVGRWVDQVFPPKDPMSFFPSCDFKDDDFLTKFESVQQRGGVFYFMGHSYQFMNEADWEEFERRLEYLNAAGVEWVELPDLFASRA